MIRMSENRYYTHNFVDDQRRTRYIRLVLEEGRMQFIVIDDATGEVCESFNGPISRMTDKNDFITENLGDHWSHYISPKDIHKVYYLGEHRTDKKMDAVGAKEYGLVLSAHKRSDEKTFLTAMGLI